MSEGDTVDGTAPSPTPEHLQDGKRWAAKIDELLAALGDDGLHEQERVGVARERAEALLVQSAQVERMRATGFAGREFELFRAELASYGLAVMRALIRRGEIYKLCFDQGRPLSANYTVRTHLAEPGGGEDRLELANETVAKALDHFRTIALLGGTWKPHGGARLTTFFIGACAQVFPNIFRDWLKREHSARRDNVPHDDLVDDRNRLFPEASPGNSPEDVAIRRAVIADALDRAPNPSVRQAIGEIAVTGGAYAGLAERLGTTEDALKQAVSRYRASIRDARKEIDGD